DPSLTYNVRVGTTPGGSDVLAPMSLTSGQRLVPEAGNAGHNHSIVLRGLSPERTYYWTVQSVDHRLVGSAFATERVSYGVQPPTPPAPGPVVSENYPNPFNPSTTIRFTLPSASPVRLVVYNVLGAEVAVLMDQSLEAGSHQAVWNATDAMGRQVPSGVYLYSLETREARVTHSMLLLK
ncbi:MAG TPA: FlgD immunoglobulin-like domain containing protein, partial [Rhodothermales bacterium]